ncbi:MAG: hypothetical protein HFJ53_07930 [Clostridia bacterium]|jgi:spore germination protein YaaH|nr:hypothetical protein [Clostridia bacterium]
MKKVNISNIGVKIAIVVGILIIVAAILIIVPNFKKDKNEGKVNFILNNNNVTSKLKKDIFIDENTKAVYVSKEDMENYFDGQIYYDKENEQLITTSDTKVAVMPMNSKTIKINSSEVKIIAPIIKKEATLYIPISELGNVYNIEIDTINNSIVTVDSLDREFIKADIIKNTNVKYNTKLISKTVDKLKEGDKVVWISEKNGWARIRTQNGKIGYIKSDRITNKTTVREKMEPKKQIEGKINLVWDYYSEYVDAPDRTGTTIEGINVVSPSFFSLDKGDTVKIIDNAARGGQNYIKWAKQNGYKIWAMFSNNSMRETTSKILNNYKQREKLIEEIVKLAIKYEVDGINVDFENMNMSDKDVYSRFIIELAPRLREYGMVISVDVTAPDGSENWSLCFNRNVIAKEADYIVFMAYDQYGVSSTNPGTTAGGDWVELNINKFLGQEDIKAEKIILGMPLYTRLWKTDETGKSTSVVVNMNKIEEKLPKDVQKVWDENTKQYYIEYEEKAITYRMWIEDERSIQEKLNLINKYNLSGGAFWEKDRETSNIWKITKETLNIK